jgi:hypothetical protein
MCVGRQGERHRPPTLLALHVGGGGRPRGWRHGARPEKTMMTPLKTRRIAAVLGVAVMTNAAGFLAAQQPATAPINGLTPTYYPCDPLVDSCGDALDGGDSLDGAGQCGSGSRILCEEITTKQCLQYVPITVQGSGGLSGFGGTTTMVCAVEVIKVQKKFLP